MHLRKYEKLPKGFYMNQYGEHKFDKRWSRELTMVTNNACRLSGRNPSDRKQFFRAADSLVGSRTALSGHDLLHLYAAAHLKLPHAVEAWMQWLREPGSPVVLEGGPAETRGPRTAAEFCNCCCELAAALNGFEATWEHEELSTGQQTVLLGPWAFFNVMDMFESGGDDTTYKTSVLLGKKKSQVPE